MADTKTSALTAEPAEDDLIMAVDISDTTMAASGTNKKVKKSNMRGITDASVWLAAQFWS